MCYYINDYRKSICLAEVKCVWLILAWIEVLFRATSDYKTSLQNINCGTSL